MITFIKDPRGSIGAEIIFDIFSTDRTAKFSQKEKKNALREGNQKCDNYLT